MRSEFRSWDDGALLAGRRRSRTLFRRKREANAWAVASNSEIDFSIYKTQNSVGGRGDPIGDERAIWRVTPTHRRQLIAGESVAWATSLPVKRSGPSSGPVTSSDLIIWPRIVSSRKCNERIQPLFRCYRSIRHAQFFFPFSFTKEIITIITFA